MADGGNLPVHAGGLRYFATPAHEFLRGGSPHVHSTPDGPVRQPAWRAGVRRRLLPEWESGAGQFRSMMVCLLFETSSAVAASTSVLEHASSARLAVIGISRRTC